MVAYLVLCSDIRMTGWTNCYELAKEEEGNKKVILYILFMH